MTAANRMLLAFLAIVAALAAFWFLALGPKRQEASDLTKKLDPLKAEVIGYEQQIADGVEARRNFPKDYQQLVLLGKATPNGDESASFLVQVNEVSDQAKTQFRQLVLAASDSSTTEAPAAPVAPAAPTATEPPPEGSEAPPVATAAPATEASAATLPIGATIGTAGLGVMPFELEFIGDFTTISDFLAGLDRLVKTDAGHVAVDGRLITVNGFSLTQDKKLGFPHLVANLTVSTYVTPEDEGLTAGATPTAPAPAGTVPASTTTPPTP
jgi:hypothetical protein